MWLATISVFIWKPMQEEVNHTFMLYLYRGNTINIIILLLVWHLLLAL